MEIAVGGGDGGGGEGGGAGAEGDSDSDNANVAKSDDDEMEGPFAGEMKWLEAGKTKKKIRSLIRSRFVDPAEFDTETESLIAMYAPLGDRVAAGAAQLTWMERLEEELGRQWGVHVAVMRGMKVKETVPGSAKPSYKRCVQLRSSLFHSYTRYDMTTSRP